MTSDTDQMNFLYNERLRISIEELNRVILVVLIFIFVHSFANFPVLFQQVSEEEDL